MSRVKRKITRFRGSWLVLLFYVVLGAVLFALGVRLSALWGFEAYEGFTSGNVTPATFINMYFSVALYVVLLVSITYLIISIANSTESVG